MSMLKIDHFMLNHDSFYLLLLAFWKLHYGCGLMNFMIFFFFNFHVQSVRFALFLDWKCNFYFKESCWRKAVSLQTHCTRSEISRSNLLEKPSWWTCTYTAQTITVANRQNQKVSSYHVIPRWVNHACFVLLRNVLHPVL